MNKNYRRLSLLKRLTIPDSVKVIKCKYCRQPVTYSYGSLDRDGKRLLTNVNGTRHVDRGESE